MAEDMKPNEPRRKKLVPVLSRVLVELCKRNDHIPIDPQYITKFHATKTPGITIEDYLQRISKYSGCSEECFILSLIYIDRLINQNQNLIVNSLCVHRLVITSLMLSAKFFDDHYFNNAYYGKVGGVNGKEVNSLEIEFLFMINFNLYVSEKEFDMYHKKLEEHASNIVKTDSDEKLDDKNISNNNDNTNDNNNIDTVQNPNSNDDNDDNNNDDKETKEDSNNGNK